MPGLARHRVGARSSPAGCLAAHLKTGELAFHHRSVPDGQPPTKTRLIRAAGLRWPVEEDFEFSKRTASASTSPRPARHRHHPPRRPGHGRPAISADQSPCVVGDDRGPAPPPVRPCWPPPAEPGIISLTIPEIKRLLASLTADLCGQLCHPPGRWTASPPGPLPMVSPRARLARNAEIALLQPSQVRLPY